MNQKAELIREIFVEKDPNKKKFILRSLDVIANAVAFIQELPLEPVYEILIRPFHDNRSLAQNRLWHMWKTDVSKHTGETEEEVEHRYKKQFLVGIFEEDDDQYALMIQYVRDAWNKGAKKDAKMLSENIVRLTHTSDANVNQMTKFLNKVEADMMSHNIPFRHPDDYHRAMGIKQ